MVTLFGIQYADEISKCEGGAREIIRLSELRGKRYGPAIRTGVKLARYVTLRPEE